MKSGSGRLWQSILKSKGARVAAHQALSKWQYLAGSSPVLHEIGIDTWRVLVSRFPIRDHLLVCDPRARSPLSLPGDTRALTTTAADAKLDFFGDVLREAEALAEAPDVEQVFDAMTRGGDRYRFRLPLNPRDVTDPANDVFVKFALQPKIAGIVQSYFRVPCCLHEVTVLLDRPTPDPPAESQRWHRDPDDWITLSVFVYLSDVDAGTAPFCYVPLPESRRLYGKVGAFRQFPTWHVIPDAAMERIVPRERWIEVIGPTGTMTFIDSASCYHRGKQAVSGRRLCLHLIFTSTMTRMEMTQDWAKLLERDSERRFASESPEYRVASSLPSGSVRRETGGIHASGSTAS